MRRKKAMANLKGRVVALERPHLRDQPVYGVQFDRDALAIYNAMAYLDATMEPTYHEVGATAIYVRGEEVRDARYGPIIPAHLDEHLRRYTRASGEFELAFGREPNPGDILQFEHVAAMHSSEAYSPHFGRLIGAWKRQLPNLECPLKFEHGQLFRRLRPEGRRNELPKWEQDKTIQPEVRWLEIPEVLAQTDFHSMQTISAVVFIGVQDLRHGCRPATDEELERPATESPLREPEDFVFTKQRLSDILLEVFGV